MGNENIDSWEEQLRITNSLIQRSYANLKMLSAIIEEQELLNARLEKGVANFAGYMLEKEKE